MTPDFSFGYYLATTPDAVLHLALSHRPMMLGRFHQLNSPPPQELPDMLPGEPDIVLNRVRQANPNQRRLSRVVPPPTIRSQRRIAKIRLMRMQRELSYPCDSIPEPVTSEIEIGGTIHDAA